MAILTAPAPTGGDDQTIIQNFLNSISAGDYVSFPQGSTYRHSARLSWKAAASNVTLMAEGVVWRATNSSNASFYFNGATNVEIVGLWHRTDVQPTTRVNLGFDVGLFVFSQSTGIKLNRIRATGSAGLSVYYWGSTGGEIKNSIVENSLADGWHFTNGSGGFTVTDCQALNTGDDGFAHVGYNTDGVNGRPQNITLIRPVVRDCRARAISYSGAVDCTANDVDLDGSLAASIYFATERGDFTTLDTARCTVNGGRVVGAGRSYAAIDNGTDGAGKDQGTVLWLASGSGATVVDCVVNDLSVGNTGAANYDIFRAIQYGGTFTRCSANRTQIYAGMPSTYIGGNIPSAISPATSTDRRSETIYSSTANVGTLPAAGNGTTPATIVGGVSFGTPIVKARVEFSQLTNFKGWWRFDEVTSSNVVRTNGQTFGRVDDRANTSGTTTDFIQATTGNQPTWYSTPFGNARFASGKYLTSAAVSVSDSAQTTYVVMRSTSNSAERTMVGSSGDGGLQFRTLNGKLDWTRQGQAILLTGKTTVPLNTVLIVSGVYSSTAGKSLYLNGALDASDTVATTLSASRTGVMGAGYSFGEGWLGDIFEVVMFNKAHSPEERAAVHSMLSDRYGVSVADYQAPPSQSTSVTPTTSTSGATIGQPTAIPGERRVTPSPAFYADPQVGQPTTATSVSAAASTVASTASIGQPAAVSGALAATPGTVTAGSALGVPAALAGAVTSVPAALPSGALLGQPVASAGVVSVSPSTAPSTSTAGTPTAVVAIAGTANPTSVSSGSSVGAPAAVPGPVSVAPTTRPSTTSTGAVTAAGGSVTATPETRVSAVAIGSFTATPGAVSVAVPALGSTSSVGAATAAGGVAGAAPASVPSGTVLGQPAAVAGATSVAPSAVPSTSSTGTPTATPGPLTTATGTITSGSTTGAVTATSSISRTPTPRATATSFGIVVVASTVSASPATIAPGARAGATSAGAGPYVIVVASIEPTSAVGSVSAEKRGGVQDIDVIVGVPRLAVYVLEPRTRAVSSPVRTAWRVSAPTI